MKDAHCFDRFKKVVQVSSFSLTTPLPTTPPRCTPTPTTPHSELRSTTRHPEVELVGHAFAVTCAAPEPSRTWPAHFALVVPCEAPVPVTECVAHDLAATYGAMPPGSGDVAAMAPAFAVTFAAPPRVVRDVTPALAVTETTPLRDHHFVWSMTPALGVAYETPCPVTAYVAHALAATNAGDEDNKKNKQTNKQNKQTNKQTHTHTHTHSNIQTCKQAHKLTNKQARNQATKANQNQPKPKPTQTKKTKKTNQNKQNQQNKQNKQTKTSTTTTTTSSHFGTRLRVVARYCSSENTHGMRFCGLRWMEAALQMTLQALLRSTRGHSC